MTKRLLKITILSLLFTLLSSTSLCSEIIPIPAAAYSVDIPGGWQLLDNTDPARVSFSSSDAGTVLQVMVFNQDQYATAPDFYENIKTQLAASGDGAPFLYAEMDAVFADLSFNTGTFDVRGYFVFINGQPFDYALLCFSHQDFYQASQDLMLSALDSFAISGTAGPGPVSSFLAQGAGDQPLAAAVKIGVRTYQLTATSLQLQTSLDVINREARILAAFPALNMAAWQRFYRVLYRDNATRLADMFRPVLSDLGKMNKPARAETLLTWIQGFDFTRTGSVADFTSPLEAALYQAGDCDSRVLLYLVLLHQLDLNAILLVSSTYKHAAAGLDPSDYPGKGAMVGVDGKKYLYTELTARVAIGMVASDKADPAKWTGFLLGPR